MDIIITTSWKALDKIEKTLNACISDAKCMTRLRVGMDSTIHLQLDKKIQNTKAACQKIVECLTKCKGLVKEGNIKELCKILIKAQDLLYFLGEMGNKCYHDREFIDAGWGYSADDLGTSGEAVRKLAPMKNKIAYIVKNFIEKCQSDIGTVVAIARKSGIKETIIDSIVKQFNMSGLKQYVNESVGRWAKMITDLSDISMTTTTDEKVILDGWFEADPDSIEWWRTQQGITMKSFRGLEDEIWRLFKADKFNECQRRCASILKGLQTTSDRFKKLIKMTKDTKCQMVGKKILADMKEFESVVKKNALTAWQKAKGTDAKDEEYVTVYGVGPIQQSTALKNAKIFLDRLERNIAISTKDYEKRIKKGDKTVIGVLYDEILNAKAFQKELLDTANKYPWSDVKAIYKKAATIWKKQENFARKGLNEMKQKMSKGTDAQEHWTEEAAIKYYTDKCVFVHKTLSDMSHDIEKYLKSPKMGEQIRKMIVQVEKWGEGYERDAYDWPWQKVRQLFKTMAGKCKTFSVWGRSMLNEYRKKQYALGKDALEKAYNKAFDAIEVKYDGKKCLNMLNRLCEDASEKGLVYKKGKGFVATRKATDADDIYSKVKKFCSSHKGWRLRDIDENGRGELEVEIGTTQGFNTVQNEWTKFTQQKLGKFGAETHNWGNNTYGLIVAQDANEETPPHILAYLKKAKWDNIGRDMQKAAKDENLCKKLIIDIKNLPKYYQGDKVDEDEVDANIGRAMRVVKDLHEYYKLYESCKDKCVQVSKVPAKYRTVETDRVFDLLKLIEQVIKGRDDLDTEIGKCKQKIATISKGLDYDMTLSGRYNHLKGWIKDLEDAVISYKKYGDGADYGERRKAETVNRLANEAISECNKALKENPKDVYANQWKKMIEKLIPQAKRACKRAKHTWR